MRDEVGDKLALDLPDDRPFKPTAYPQWAEIRVTSYVGVSPGRSTTPRGSVFQVGFQVRVVLAKRAARSGIPALAAAVDVVRAVVDPSWREGSTGGVAHGGVRGFEVRDDGGAVVAVWGWGDVTELREHGVSFDAEGESIPNVDVAVLTSTCLVSYSAGAGT